MKGIIHVASMETDRLEHELRQGKASALAALLQHYRRRLKRMLQFEMDDRLARRLNESDVLQEVYVDAQRQLQSFAKNDELSAYVWLRQLALNRLWKTQRTHIHTQQRSLRRESVVSSGSSQRLAQHLIDSGTGPLASLLREEMAVQVRQAIMELADDDQRVLAMRHYEEMNNREIAQALGLSESGATRRYGRALRRLQDCLTDGLGEPSN